MPAIPLSFTIMGVPRSGTTALVRATNLHPRVFCTNEWQLGLRAADPGFILPDALLDPERFQIDRMLRHRDMSLLNEKLARGEPLVLGDKLPRYYMSFERLKAALPNARHTALYRSPYAFSMSWDARARNEQDALWGRGQIGLFAILDWLLFLDRIATFAADLRLITFDDLFFGPSGHFADWLSWASGLPVDWQTVAMFEATLSGKRAPDESSTGECPYKELLDAIGARDMNAVASQTPWTATDQQAPAFRAFVEAAADRVVDDIGTRAPDLGHVITSWGHSWLAHLVRVYRACHAPSPILFAAIDRLAQRLSEADAKLAGSAPQSSATPAGRDALPSPAKVRQHVDGSGASAAAAVVEPPADIRAKVRGFLQGRLPVSVVDGALLAASLPEQRRALYAAFDVCFGPGATPVHLGRLDQIVAVVRDAVTRREEIIHQYLRQRDAAAAQDLFAFASDKGDPHATSWAVFLDAHARYHAQPEERAQPNRIIQFWDREPPPEVAASMDAWRDLIGPANYVRYNDASGRDLLSRVVGQRGTQAYDACWHAAMRSDLVRLAAVFDAGGLWLDADLAPLPGHKLPALGTALHLAFTAQDPNPRFQNDMMVAAAGHPLIGDVIERCLHKVLVERVEAPNGATGPYVFTEVIRLRASRGLGDGATALSRPESRAWVARGYSPQYKTSKTDRRSWQVALRARQETAAAKG
jgi:hypothetical protein